MIKLHQLHKHPKSTHRKKVVGRGLGSGRGTYARAVTRDKLSEPDTAKCRQFLKAAAAASPPIAKSRGLGLYAKHGGDLTDLNVF